MIVRVGCARRKFMPLAPPPLLIIWRIGGMGPDVPFTVVGSMILNVCDRMAATDSGVLVMQLVLLLRDGRGITNPMRGHGHAVITLAEA